MLARALTSEIPCQWVTACEAYGSDHQFWLFCKENQLSYVVAITSQTHLYWNGQRMRVSEHVAQFSAEMWRQLSCGAGCKGERFYDWAYVSWPHHEQENLTRGFLVRRSLSDPIELAYYLTCCPHRTPLQRLVKVAGSRWAIEEVQPLVGKRCCSRQNITTGLDEYEVRNWVGWHRHIMLSMLAHATLSVIRSQSFVAPLQKKSELTDSVDGSRSSPLTGGIGIQADSGRNSQPEVVPLAPPAPTAGSPLPLQKTWPRSPFLRKSNCSTRSACRFLCWLITHMLEIQLFEVGVAYIVRLECFDQLPTFHNSELRSQFLCAKQVVSCHQDGCSVFTKCFQQCGELIRC